VTTLILDGFVCPAASFSYNVLPALMWILLKVGYSFSDLHGNLMERDVMKIHPYAAFVYSSSAAGNPKYIGRLCIRIYSQACHQFNENVDFAFVLGTSNLCSAALQQ